MVDSNSNESRPKPADATQLEPGMRVVDLNGAVVGEVRAVYPNYAAVEAHGGEEPTAFRVPLRAITTIGGGEARLSIPRDALDAMTPTAESAVGLPDHAYEQIDDDDRAPLEDAPRRMGT